MDLTEPNVNDGQIVDNIYVWEVVLNLLFNFVGDKVVCAHSKKSYDVQEIGIMYPNEMPTGVL